MDMYIVCDMHESLYRPYFDPLIHYRVWYELSAKMFYCTNIEQYKYQLT